ncbi:MAG: hypothetical protein ABIQ73_30005 [Acidimicrobiales bacterium]
MIVDSFRFLPRSFRSAYEVEPTGEPDVWSEFGVRLADASIALVTSAGLYVADTQQPFDLDRERAEPTWGDPSHRIVSSDAGLLGMAHLHVNDADVLADRNVALPLDVLAELVTQRIVGASSPNHVSVMGYQGDLTTWRTQTTPAIAELLIAQGTHGAVLAPV